jgi:hypothetical protein
MLFYIQNPQHTGNNHDVNAKESLLIITKIEAPLELRDSICVLIAQKIWSLCKVI